MAFDGLPKGLFTFLEELGRNNKRDWFLKNKPRFESDVVAPMVELMTAIQPRMRKEFPFIGVDPSKNGGSMMRIYRDVRFSKDKSPYNTHVAAQFRHVKGRDMHAPGFYLHLSPKESFLGTGIWQPDGPTLDKIRKSIAGKTRNWIAARDDSAYRKAGWEPAGESLKRPPAGYPPDHPCIEDLKRKDFAAFRKVDRAEATKADFADRMVDDFAASRPLMKFVCDALDLSF